MEFKCYPLLGTRSRRALLRQRKAYGHPYEYSPRPSLLERLSLELNSDKETVLRQLRAEREFLLRERNR